MATTKDILNPRMNSTRSNPLPTAQRSAPVGISSVRLTAGVQEFKDRRRRRRVDVQPMYTFASLRVLSRRDNPLEGHILNLSETGLVVEVDDLIAIGQPVTIEFSISGLGRLHGDAWPTYAVAAEVVRIDDLAEFPQGPYKTALRFVRIPTMAQAQIARYVATHESKAIV